MLLADRAFKSCWNWFGARASRQKAGLSDMTSLHLMDELSVYHVVMQIKFGRFAQCKSEFPHTFIGSPLGGWAFKWVLHVR